ncbi:MAG: class I SAM-dependent methyltransferase [Promethearchaeia archaeon]
MKKEHKNAQKKEKIIKKYNSSAQVYDRRYKDLQFRKFKLSLGKIDLSERVLLDVGCGTGLLLDFLSHFTSSIQTTSFLYVGTDISREMLYILRKKLKDMVVTKSKIEKLPTSIHLVVSDAEHLPFRPKVFETILSFTVIQNLSNNKLFFREVLDLIKNKGDLVLSTLKKKKTDLEDFRSFCKSRVHIPEENEIIGTEDVIYVGKTLKSPRLKDGNSYESTKR